MKLRTRLPRASTNAAVAIATPDEQLEPDSEPHADSGTTMQQCSQILQQLESFDNENVFTGPLAAGGRLAPEGPVITHNLRYCNHYSVVCVLQHAVVRCTVAGYI